MKKDISLLYLLIMVSILLSSCEKAVDSVLGGKPDTQTINVDSNFKVHFYFKEGTYWVYKDSLSGYIDSMVVTGASLGGFENQDHTRLDENVEISINTYHQTTNQVGKSGLTLYSNFAQFYHNLQTDNASLDLDYTFLFNYPLKLGDSTTQVGLSLNTNNQIFMDVAEIHHTTSGLWGSLDTCNDWFYINDSIGIVKMSIKHNPGTYNHLTDTFKQVWELQRYHIVK